MNARTLAIIWVLLLVLACTSATEPNCHYHERPLVVLYGIQYRDSIDTAEGRVPRRDTLIAEASKQRSWDATPACEAKYRGW